MKSVIAGILIIALIMGVTLYLQERVHHDDVLEYARKFKLEAIGEPEHQFWSMGPFYLRNDHQQIWSLKTNKGELWVRFGMWDDVYLVDGEKEKMLK